VAVHNKSVYAEGKPEDLVTQDMVQKVFQMECEIAVGPLSGTPKIFPHGRGRKLNGNSVTLSWLEDLKMHILAAEYRLTKIPRITVRPVSI